MTAFFNCGIILIMENETLKNKSILEIFNKLDFSKITSLHIDYSDNGISLDVDLTNNKTETKTPKKSSLDGLFEPKTEAQIEAEQEERNRRLRETFNNTGNVISEK